MKFRHPSASMLAPDACGEPEAWNRITHLGIGAHPDDLEFMALHGILACHNRDDAWFGGVTCTDGAGSPQASGAPNLPPEQLADRRREEQDEAARIGGYGVMVQLGYSSAEAKNPGDTRLTDDLADILTRCRPRVVYTHNPADKHDTHVAVTSRVIAAIRRLPREQRPQRVLGCEVWRDLDWLNDEDKVLLDVGGNPGLAERLTSIYASQIQGGKRYDLAVRGRAVAHATFQTSHAADGPLAVWLAMDLTPLIVSDTITLMQFVNAHLARFKNDVMEKLSTWERH